MLVVPLSTTIHRFSSRFGSLIWFPFWGFILRFFLLDDTCLVGVMVPTLGFQQDSNRFCLVCDN